MATGFDERMKDLLDDIQKQHNERVEAELKKRNAMITKVWNYILLATLLLSVLSLLLFGSALRF